MLYENAPGNDGPVYRWVKRYHLLLSLGGTATLVVIGVLNFSLGVVVAASELKPSSEQCYEKHSPIPYTTSAQEPESSWTYDYDVLRDGTIHPVQDMSGVERTRSWVPPATYNDSDDVERIVEKLVNHR